MRLPTVACTKAFDEAVERWKERISGTRDPKSALTALVDGYLSSRNRGLAGSGCPVAALATDVAREPEGKPVKGAYLAGLRRLIGVLVALQSTRDPTQDRSVALARLSTMVGALVLARATKGHALSNEIMAAARENIWAVSIASKAVSIASNRRLNKTHVSRLLGQKEMSPKRSTLRLG